MEKINQNNDLIKISGDSVVFNNLTIVNKDLAEYLDNADDMIESLQNIIEKYYKEGKSIIHIAEECNSNVYEIEEILKNYRMEVLGAVEE